MRGGAVRPRRRARRERYARPGALPDVELGATIAARTCAGATSASTRSPCGSPTARWRRSRARSRTSRARRLRVLHERSFLDDPTRLLRLARYARAAAASQIEEDTARLGVAAVAAGAPATVTGVAARRRAAAAAARAAARPRVRRWRGWARRRGWPPGFARRSATLGRARAGAGCPPTRAADLVALAACCVDAGAASSAERLDELEFTGRRARHRGRRGHPRALARRRVLGGVDAPVGAVGAAARARRPRRSRWPARSAPPERRPAAGSTSSAARALAIDGDDLLAAGLLRPGGRARRSTRPWAPRSTARPGDGRRSWRVRACGRQRLA